MNTTQLIVFCYAALTITGLLVFGAVGEGLRESFHYAIAYAIAAVVVMAAAVIYILKPHPVARKRVVVLGVMVPLLLGALGIYGWLRYEEWRSARAWQAAHAARCEPGRGAGWTKAERYQAVRDANPGSDLTDEEIEQLIEEATLQWNVECAPNERARLEAMRKLTEHQARIRRHRIEAADRARERQWTAGHFKTGDRVSAVNDGLIKTFSEVYSNAPRIYGTVVDTDIQGTLERYGTAEAPFGSRDGVSCSGL